VSRRRKREYNLDLVSDINVTSLVDVMMTLLIIFIIVAPMMEQGIDITLPTAEPKRIDVAEVLTISVAENERVYLEGQRVTMEELGEQRCSSRRTPISSTGRSSRFWTRSGEWGSPGSRWRRSRRDSVGQRERWPHRAVNRAR